MEAEQERVIRSDIVSFDGKVDEGWWPSAPRAGILTALLAKMTITSRVVVLDPPQVSGLTKAFSWLVWVPIADQLWGRPVPLSHRLSFELAAIDSLHSWRPAFSGAPAFQVGPDLWSFQLMSGGPPGDGTTTLRRKRCASISMRSNRRGQLREYKATTDRDAQPSSNCSAGSNWQRQLRGA